MKQIIISILLLFGVVSYSPGQKPAEIIVSSIGLDYIDGEYEVSLFNINTKTISKVETVGSVEESHSIVVNKSDNLAELMSEISNSSYREISFSQLSSIVITTNALDEIEVLDIINVFRYSFLKYMNVFVYATEEKIDEIFNIGNIENLSLYYSLLVDPMYKYSIKSFPKPITIIEYLRDYYNYSEIKIPVLSKSDVSIIENEEEVDTIIVDGYYFDEIGTIDYLDSDKSLIYINDFQVTSTTINNVSIEINNYVIKTKCKEQLCVVDVSYGAKINSYIPSSDVEKLNIDVRNNILSIIEDLHVEYKNKEIDIYNLTESVYRSSGKYVELEKIVFKINITQTLENAYI